MTHPYPSGKRMRRHTTVLGAILATSLLAGCNSLERLSQVGEEPPINPIINPTHQPGYKPVSMPMPKPVTASYAPNSLWRPGSRAFLKDLRANDIGDIVTVTIAIDEEAQLTNTTNRSRETNENVDIPALLGYGAALDSILPEAVNPADILAFDNQTTNNGTGTIARSEAITLEVAAVVTQVLPNGNLVIHGRQETRVNYEIRELQIAGVIRPQDITATNTVNYNDIAEARLAYGGRGHISDFQQPRWGTQIIDIIMPF
ncbi:MAG: flagellar basal body L-ring protein FlgH [Alphaproteobacteria bacterium]|nr:flagellar basal body L-ring protein FlgH [Alphaproteobacteria bacterium]